MRWTRFRRPDYTGGCHSRGPTDEIGRLAATMNRMLARLEDSRNSQRRFVSDASHELRSPLTTIRQHSEVALAHPEGATAEELADVVLAEANKDAASRGGHAAAGSRRRARRAAARRRSTSMTWSSRRHAGCGPPPPFGWTRRRSGRRGCRATSRGYGAWCATSPTTPPGMRRAGSIWACPSTAARRG